MCGCLVAIFLGFIIVLIGAVIPIVGTLLSIVIAIIYFSLHSKNKKAIAKIKAIHTFKIKDIINICDATKQEMGASGYFNMIVAVEGTIDNPSGDKLGFVEEDREKFINKKQIRAKDNQLYVEDGTGKILVKLDKLTDFYDNRAKSISKEVTPTEVTRYGVDLFSPSAPWGRTGYSYKDDAKIVESINGTVCIIGEASDASGELVVQKSKDFRDPFFVAFTSKKNYTELLESRSRLFVIGIIFILLALSFLGMG